MFHTLNITPIKSKLNSLIFNWPFFTIMQYDNPTLAFDISL